MSNQCELCSSQENLTSYSVEPTGSSITVCQTCLEQIENPDTMDVNHWHCLADSMWSEKPEVQIMAYRLLKRIAHEGWPQDLLDQLYLEEDVLAMAEAVSDEAEDEEDAVVTKDSNGTILNSGDSVTIIKDLEVKGGGFTAKRGTTVKNIALTNKAGEIEGRVNGTKIVLLSKFLKKL